MPKVSQMQGVPAQLEYLKSDGKRRSISKCIFSEHQGARVYICTCPLSVRYNEECHNSRNCMQYEEIETK